MYLQQKLSKSLILFVFIIQKERMEEGQVPESAKFFQAMGAN